ncbi:methyl-accepting chemotaxis protein [Thiohalorhabdus sp. Cl-TMA]|uniref:Methyl-accepting chemotaxis protein n=1 Tax=Thiohalorhabdus methylotrophus TaxID=3242694 RepID=A0ABV4TXD2_9GAMM
MSTLNIRQRILLGISAILVLWILIVAVTYIVQNRQAELLEQYSQANRQAEAVTRMQLALVGLLPPMNGFLQSLDSEHQSDFEAELQNYKKAMNRVEQIPSLPEKARTNIKEIKDLVGNIRSTGSQVFKVDEITSTEESMTTIAESLVYLAKEKGDQLRRTLTRRAENLQEAARDQSRFAILVSLGVTGAAALIALPLTFIMMRWIRRTVDDLRSRVQEESSGILESVESQVSFAAQQEQAMGTMTQSMEQMSGVSRDIAQSASSVDEVARETRETARNGAKDVERVVRSMEEIRNGVRDINNKITHTGTKAQQIADAVASIDEIADETHMLALNAAIESAAAGEYGQRFGVVAAEVRRLAERTREFTDEANRLMQEVRASTQSSIEATEAGVQSVEQGVDMTKQAGQALSGILDMTDRTAQATQQIATSTEEQDASTAEVRQQLEDISIKLKESAQGLQRSKEIAYRLNEVSDRMSQEL